jgi:hypothetical protein
MRSPKIPSSDLHIQVMEGWASGPVHFATSTTGTCSFLPLSPSTVSRHGRHYAGQPIDVFSLEIDGVDMHVATELFKDPGFDPKVVIVQYNGVFPPPLEFNELMRFFH